MAYVTSEKSNVDQLIGGTAVAALTKNITLKGLEAEKTFILAVFSMQRKCLLALALILCRHTRKSCVQLAFT